MEQLTDDEKTRYQRQMLLEGWGEPGQVKLKSSSVFIAGVGGLGSPASLYLAAAGVGEIKICDADKVALSNLNRQILHTDARIGQQKAASARKTLSALNPTIRITTACEYLDGDNVGEIVGRPDVIVDCLDNFETRFLLNAYCIAHHIPLVHGAVHGLMGQLTFTHPPETPCLRCIFLNAPPQETWPVLGATPGIIGSMQAMETLKFLTGVGTNLKGKLWFFDGEEMAFSAIDVKRTPSCPACGGQDDQFYE